MTIGGCWFDQLKTQTSAYNDFIKLRQEIKTIADDDRVNYLIEYLYRDTDAAAQAF